MYEMKDMAENTAESFSAERLYSFVYISCQS